MIRAYCGEPEKECKEEDVKKYAKLFESANINILVTHTQVKPMVDIEISPAAIDALEKSNPNDINQPLQRNGFYAFTPVVEAGTKRQPIFQLLKKVSPLRKQYQVYLSLPLPQQKDLADFPDEGSIVKDIIYIEEQTQNQVGWYNYNANLIWLGDVLHFVDHMKTILPDVLNPIIDLVKTGKINDTLTVGADPEFEIVDQDEALIGAQYIFPRKDGEIGCDGHADTGELRPPPSRSPLGLSRNIKRLVRKLNGLNGVRGNKIYVGGGQNVSTGGHIHFGMKAMPDPLKHILFDMVGAHVLKAQSKFRNDHQGNTISKNGTDVVRAQPHGVEWRLLPSFIVNEDITTAVLCTTYAIVKSFKFHDYKPKVLPEKVTKEDFEKIPLYPVYREWIDKFCDLFILADKPKKLFKKDILEEWSIPKLNKEFTVEIYSDEEWITGYFKPINANLKKNVKLGIRFAGDRIHCENIPKEGIAELQEFSDEHYLPDVTYPNKKKVLSRDDDNEDEFLDPGDLAPATRGKAGTKSFIQLPQAWRKANKKPKLCREIKHIIQKIVVLLGEGE